MKVKYLGTGGAEGVPGIFCNCKFCTFARKAGGRELRFRSHMLIDDVLLIDFNADTYAASLRTNCDLSAVENIIITHTHSDHFMPIDLNMRAEPFAHGMKSSKVALWGNAQMKSRYAEIMKDTVSEKAQISVNILKVFEKTKIGEYQITALAANHKPDEDAFIYIIEKNEKTLFYFNDSGQLPEKTKEYLRGLNTVADLISFDCANLEAPASKHAGHMGLEDIKITIDFLRTCGVVTSNTKLFATHFSHNALMPYAALKKLCKLYKLTPSCDGMVIEI